MIHHGDCLEVMAGLEPESVDAVVTDPPYDLLSTGARNGSRRINNPDNPAGRSARGFMGKAWDGTGIAFRRETWELAYRVAKPSAYLLAFGGTRTVHRLTSAIEDAGWIIRDMLVWAYASGFPKSKASLKPAWEPIVMARKPGPLRMLAIDECRIGVEGGASVGILGDGLNGGWGEPIPGLGRWPANVILTDPIFDGGWDGVVGGGSASNGGEPSDLRGIGGIWHEGNGVPAGPQYGDSGTYSRFFILPKADRADREPVLGGLPESDELRGSSVMQTHCAKCGRQRVNVPGAACSCPDPEWVRDKSQRARANVHPTVKPVDLMRHLVRLVTPTGGTVLDPFLGSGTTAIAAEMEGFDWIGIEKEREYCDIAEARLNGTQRGLGLPA